MLISGWVLSVPVDFPIASARIRFSHHLLIQIQAKGSLGIGEGVLYRALPHQVADSFRRLVRTPVLRKNTFYTTMSEGDAWNAQVMAASPGLACAVNVALWDLWGNHADRSVADLAGGTHQARIPITEQVFIRDWPSAEKELQAILSRGTRSIKVKVGTNPKADLETVRQVRAFVGPEVQIRVDANRAYTLGEAYGLYWGLADLGVLALEEPLTTGDRSRLKELRRRIGLPIILDESVLTLGDLRGAIDAGALDILNVKLARLGGMSEALRHIRLCQANGIQVALGCSEELGVGTAAILHLGAVVPQLHSMEGLGPQRLGFDIVAEPWQIRNGELALPTAPGLGVDLLGDWQDQLCPHSHCFELGDQSWRLRAFSWYSRWFQRANNVAWRLRRRMTRT